MIKSMNSNDKKSLLSRIGLAKKSGKIISGTDLVCDGARDGNVLSVLVAGNASENSKKRVLNCTSYYEVKAYVIDSLTTEELGKAIGKSATACIGITDENILKLVVKGIENN